MISKLRFSLIAFVMLVLLGFGFQDQAKGQVGAGGLFCPAVPNTIGYLEAEIVGSGAVTPDFTGALIGTVESVGGNNVGGLDWQHVDFTSFETPTPTNETGAQLVSWWTQKNARNTYLQVTNSGFDSVNVHVRIHNEDCTEIRDFCDFYTPNDTHEYNLGNLFANNGADIADANLQGVEGWLVVTAVADCNEDTEQAIDFDQLSGQLIVVDSDDYVYGVNTYARQSICFDADQIEVNLIENGSFETGALPPWSNQQGNSGVINSQGISPSVQPPSGDFMAFLASSARPGFSGGSYLGGSFGILATDMLINTGVSETNVSVIQSNTFSPDSSNVASYDLAFLAPSDAIIAGCDNYAAVLLIDTAGGGSIEDAACYNEFGAGFVSTNNGNVNCTIAQDDNVAYALSPFEFDGGRSNFFFDSLSIPGAGSYVIQVVTGQIADGQCNLTNFNGDTGALVDDFEVLQLVDDPNNDCNGRLTGAFNAMLDNITPDTLYAQFNLLPGNDTAGADVVHINFADQYGPPYRPVAAFSNVEIGIYDQFENFQSCGDATVCFVRLGVDDPLVLSEDFIIVTPTPTPTVTPTAPPVTPTPIPTPTPSPTQGPGGSGSCAIAGSPVQLGTALANVLIPLVPVAFAFGVRAVRRRKK